MATAGNSSRYTTGWPNHHSTFLASSGSTETLGQNDWMIISTSSTASGSVAMIMSMAITVSGITG